MNKGLFDLQITKKDVHVLPVKFANA